MSATDDRGEGLRTAVLGTGIMGAAMARNLLRAGLRTTVWDGSASATAPRAEAGPEGAATPAAAVRDAGVVITMLPTPDVVTSVIFDEDVAGAFAQWAAWAQMGTIGEAASAEIAGRLGRARPAGRAGDDETGVLGDRPQAPVARQRAWPGEPDEDRRQRLHVHPHRGCRRGAGTGHRAGRRHRQAGRGDRGRPARRATRGRQAAQDGARRLRARVPARVGPQGRGPGASRSPGRPPAAA